MNYKKITDSLFVEFVDNVDITKSINSTKRIYFNLLRFT